ncbi:response regulator [Devosia sp. PTR5]|uniref:Response regulator n=1 Tax=Devosia oryzisoli TaxID=2774138 RepID=A0A927IQQ3_9HYPH|nr:response regulator [Devosia oryzisoli]
MTRVLYVEDEALLAISMEGVLVDEGFSVELAFDGSEGLEKASQFVPDIIVTDYMMPKLDGLGMVGILREQGIDTPVIVTTAVPEEKLAPELLSNVYLYPNSSMHSRGSRPRERARQAQRRTSTEGFISLGPGRHCCGFYEVPRAGASLRQTRCPRGSPGTEACLLRSCA